MSTPSKMKDKIEKLLIKAERTDNEHERDAYTAQAQRLMLKWGIEAAELEARGEAQAEAVVEVHRTWDHPLATIWVTFTNDVAYGMGQGLKVLRSGARNRHTAYVIGHQTDVENLWTLMDSLERQATAAMKAWWKTSEERTWGLSAFEQYKVKREFIRMFGVAVGQRLRKQREEVQAEASSGAALVLVGKDARVKEWVDNKYKKLRKGRSTQQGISGGTAGWSAGQRADLGNSPKAIS